MIPSPKNRTLAVLTIAVAIAAGAMTAVFILHPRPLAPEPAPTLSQDLVAQAYWPVFHGTNEFDGHTSSALPAKPRLLWKFQTPGPINSSPIIAQGMVFVGSDDGLLHAINLATGREFWNFQAAAELQSTPAWCNNCIYIGCTDGNVYAVLAQGKPAPKLLWKYQTGDKILGPINFFSTTGDAKKTLILAGSYDFSLHAIDAATGKPAWTCKTNNYVNGGPAVADATAVFGGCDGILRTVSLPDGRRRREIPSGVYIAGSPAISTPTKQAFFGDMGKTFNCADLPAGRIRWSVKTQGDIVSTPAVKGDRVVVGCRDHNLYCFDRSDGHELWKYTARGEVDSSPVIADDKVIFGDNAGWITIAGLATGRELWTYEVGDSVPGSPAVAKGVFVITTTGGWVYAFCQDQ